MATTRALLTPTADTTPAIARVPGRELSGAQWVARFMTSTSIDDCTAPFREGLQSFVNALQSAGAQVSIAATYRPPERAYLMHWCWQIVNGNADPRTVPAREGVSIQWAHATAAGAYSRDASLTAARAMVDGYGMQSLGVAPALNSKHTQGLAVDMSISWDDALSIVDARGRAVRINTTPRSGMNTDLHGVGATFGVIKYNGGGTDRPHWSDAGN